MNNSYWEGCNRKGLANEQFIFRIQDSQCHPVQIYNYTNRCSIPLMVDTSYGVVGANTYAPTYAGTVAPTENTFAGNIAESSLNYIKHEHSLEELKEKLNFLKIHNNSHIINNNNLDIVDDDQIVQNDHDNENDNQNPKKEKDNSNIKFKEDFMFMP